MTAGEMVIAFKQGLDKFDSLNYPDFEADQIDLLLNQAQDTFVKQRYGSTNVKRKSFEETQKRTEDIKNVVVNAILTPTPNAADNINTNAVFVTLPQDYWIAVQELTGVSYLDCKGVTVTDRVYTLAIQHNDYSKLIDNPFGKPKEDKILRLMENGRVELIPPSNVTITDYHLRYIKEPVRIDSINIPNVDCELSSMVHQEIVNIAVQIALEGIEARRNQTFTPIVESKQE